VVAGYDDIKRGRPRIESEHEQKVLLRRKDYVGYAVAKRKLAKF
jgi:hypothetical protein